MRAIVLRACKPLLGMGRTCKALQDGHPHGQSGQQLAHRQAVQAHGVSHLSRLPTSASVATSHQRPRYRIGPDEWGTKEKPFAAISGGVRAGAKASGQGAGGSVGGRAGGGYMYVNE